jgi:hypothetical protein
MLGYLDLKSCCGYSLKLYPNSLKITDYPLISLIFCDILFIFYSIPGGEIPDEENAWHLVSEF